MSPELKQGETQSNFLITRVGIDFGGFLGFPMPCTLFPRRNWHQFRGMTWNSMLFFFSSCEAGIDFKM